MHTNLAEWGVATAALPGQTECGDLHVVAHFPDGVLFAVVDGLGHGREAAAAAKIAASTLASFPNESVIALIRRCHQALKGTRGTVVSLASFSAVDSTMTWLGVGNVEGLLLRAPDSATPQHEYLLMRGGVVGHELPSLRASILTVASGDILILATDGIGSGFARGVTLSEAPQRIADRVLREFGKVTDDALVLVTRWNGDAA